MKKTTKLGKIREYIPLFPWHWIENEINYDENSVIFWDIGGSNVIKPPDDSGILRIELPKDRSRASIKLFKEVQNRGADLNYIDIVLWHYSDPSLRFNSYEVAGERLKKAADIIAILPTIPSKLKGSIDDSLLYKLEKIITEIIKKQEFKYDNTLLSTGLQSLKERKRFHKRGPLSDTYLDMMILLVYRHLKKDLMPKIGASFKGPYTYTSEIMHKCFSKTFPLLSRKTISIRIKRLQENKDYITECEAFENKFHNVSKMFKERAIKNGAYEIIKKEWQKAE